MRGLIREEIPVPADNRDRANTRRTQLVIAVTDVQSERLNKLLKKWGMPDLFDVVDQLLEIGEAYEWKVDNNE